MWRQAGFDVRVDWGVAGLDSLLGGGVKTVVVVDVLRFTTAVDVACGRGAAVTPFSFDDPDDAAAEAARIGAIAATRTAPGGDTSVPSLSPVSLRLLGPSDHVLLPSPNGSTIARRAASSGATVLAACLRNAAAVAAWIARDPDLLPVGMVAAGERWPDGTFCPSVEDMWGAGAVVAALMPEPATAAAFGLFAFEPPARPDAPSMSMSISPEAEAAARSVPAPDRIVASLQQCASGDELIRVGWGLDVEVAAALGSSRVVPRLGADKAFRNTI